MPRDIDALQLQMSADLRRFEKQMARMADISNKRLTEVERDVRRHDSKLSQAMDRTGQNMTAAFRNGLRGLGATVAAAFSAQQVVRYADSYTELQNRLKATGLEGERLATVEAQLYEAANRNGITVDAVAQLYQRATLSRKALGATDSELIALTNGVTAALRVQGVSAQQASGPLLQLGQALGGGTVRAEELNSLLEGTPIILQAAANGASRFGGDVAKLSAAIREGEVSSQELFRALLSGLPALEKQAADLPLTVSQSFVALNDALGRFVGQTDQGLSASQRLAQAIALLADNLDLVVTAGGVAVSLVGGRMVIAYATATAEAIRYQATLLTMAAAQANVSRTAILASSSLGMLRSAALFFVTTPVGIAITAIGSALALLALRGDKATASAEELSKAIRQNAQAAGTLATEAAELGGDLADTSTWAAALTGEVDKLAEAHYRAAAAAKAQAIETQRLRLLEANAQLGEANAAFGRRRAVELQRAYQAGGISGAEAAAAGANLRGSPLREVAAEAALASDEYRNLQDATKNVVAQTENLRRDMARGLDNFIPQAPQGGGGGGGTVGGARTGSDRRAAAGPTPQDLSAQREMLRLENALELARAEGREEEARALQARIDTINLTRRLAEAGVADAEREAAAHVAAVAAAEDAARRHREAIDAIQAQADAERNRPRRPWEAFAEANAGAENLRDTLDQIGVQGFSRLADSLAYAVTQADDLGDAARNVFRQMLAEILSAGIKNLGANVASRFIPSFAGFFASGGRIANGQWGVVGERGPEAVRATAGGVQVLPNSALRSLPSAAPRGAAVVQNITFDNRGALIWEDEAARLMAYADSRAQMATLHGSALGAARARDSISRSASRTLTRR